MNPLTLSRINTLYPDIRPRVYRVLEDFLKMTGRELNVVQAYRNIAEQREIYAKGRQFELLDGTQLDPETSFKNPLKGRWIIYDRKKIVTNAKPGYSFHNYGLAFDVAFAGQDPYLTKLEGHEREHLWLIYGDCVKNHGLVWGGNSITLLNGVKDLPHGELTYGLHLSDILELYDDRDMAGVWGYIDHLRKVPEGTDWLSQPWQIRSPV